MTALKMKELLDNYEHNHLRFKNLTSRTEVSAVEMSSLSARNCTLILPINSCSIGHQVLLKLQLSTGHQKKPIGAEVTGTIESINAVDARFIEVDVLLVQFVKEEWHQVLEHFEARQEEINDLVQKLKRP